VSEETEFLKCKPLTLVSEIKLQGLFKRVSPALLHAEFMEKGTNLSTNPAVFVTRLYNPSSRSGFYVTRLDDTNSTSAQDFKLKASTSSGPIMIPRYKVSKKHDTSITLDGRQSKIIVTDYNAGNTHILYSTAEIATWVNVDGKDVIVFYTNPSQHVEVCVASPFSMDQNRIIKPPNMIVTSEALGGEHFLTYTWKQESGVHHVVTEGAILLFADRRSAYNIWAPALSPGPHSRACDSILVYGPYLVRNATSNGDTLALTGDIDTGLSPTGTQIEVWANFGKITWNGQTLRITRTWRASWTAIIKAPTGKFSVPSINSSSTKWKVLDSLPEISIDYDDSLWMKADKTTSNNKYFPPYTTPVLYAGEYGFHTGNTLYRATFYGNSTFKPAGIRLDVWGGLAFGYTVWFNGRYLGHFGGNGWDDNNEQTHLFGGNEARNGKNVVLVLADRSGYRRDDGGTYLEPHTTLVPRGIRSAILIGVEDGQQALSWTIQGNAGGEDFDDNLRAPYNEDGLYAERIGAHFPGYDDSSWESGSPMDGFTGPGVKFFRTVVRLDVPDGIDAPLAFWFDINKDLVTRVELFVNGYQMGKQVTPQLSIAAREIANR
jgi:Beta-galactosidase, domain 2/Beta-galactosidase, domain 3/Beta-galactosidase jelly roll domain